jgi:hypothetical protein
VSLAVPEESQQRFGILALYEASGDRKAKTPFERIGKVAAYRLLPAALMSFGLTLILAQ